MGCYSSKESFDLVDQTVIFWLSGREHEPLYALLFHYVSSINAELSHSEKEICLLLLDILRVCFITPTLLTRIL